jgi:hypothetical protein
MNKVHFLLNNIIYASKRGLKSITLKCAGKQIQYLNVLSSLNVLEFYKDRSSPGNYVILISYYYGKPVLNSITLVDLVKKGNVGRKKWERLTNSRKSLYIANTNEGLQLVDSNIIGLRPYKLIYKVELN